MRTAHSADNGRDGSPLIIGGEEEETTGAGRRQSEWKPQSYHNQVIE